SRRPPAPDGCRPAAVPHPVPTRAEPGTGRRSAWARRPLAHAGNPVPGGPSGRETPPKLDPVRITRECGARPGWDGGRPPCGRRACSRGSCGSGEAGAASVVGMALRLGAACGGFAAGRTAKTQGLADLTLVLGLADELVVAEPVKCVLEHDGIPLAESVSTSLS